MENNQIRINPETLVLLEKLERMEVYPLFASLIKQIELKIKDIKTANSISICKLASIDIVCNELSGIVQELKEELGMCYGK